MVEELIDDEAIEKANVKPMSVLHVDGRIKTKMNPPMTSTCITFTPKGRTRPGDTVCSIIMPKE